jgi:branched-chain amino acid transport system ATP-binding protein
MTLLELDRVNVFYRDLQATFDVSMHVDEGETVAIIGANGAGKSTLLRTMIGLTQCRSGHVRFAGEDVSRLRCDLLARRGIALVPEGRRLFSSLTVEENLLLATARARKGPWTPAACYDLFPAMKQFRRARASDISGGQQQMVAISRALLTNPRLLLCDELSLGLAPKVISEIYTCFEGIRKAGVSIVLIEQDTVRARAASDRLYCLLKGKVRLAARSDAVTPDAIKDAYFGESRG